MGTNIQATWQQIENMAWGVFTSDGGPGSGNFGHAGRPGQVGGSQSKGAGTPGPVKKAFAAHEELYKTSKKEHGLVVGPDGHLIAKRTGSSDTIKWTYEECLQMENCYMTHNHPNGSTFSVNDVKFATYDRLKQIQAFGGGMRYTLTRLFDDDTDMNMISRYFGTVYETEDRMVWENLMKDAAVKSESGVPFKQIQKSFAEEYNMWAREWFKEHAENFGWEYKEEPL